MRIVIAGRVVVIVDVVMELLTRPRGERRASG
jgi:hypothetical protein